MTSEKHHADFGARLREARERRGLSLRVIADATKISVRALEALERNDISRLPGGIFSRAFVRAYALEVGLDPEHTIAEFMTRFPHEIVTQGHPRSRALEELDVMPKQRAWPALGRTALVGIPLIALIAYFAFAGHRAAPVPVQPVAAASARPEVVSTSGSSGFSVEVHAVRTTTFSVASDGQPAMDVTLDAGVSRTFHAGRELAILPVDPSAIEWSREGGPSHGVTGNLTLTPETIQAVAGDR